MTGVLGRLLTATAWRTNSATSELLEVEAHGAGVEAGDLEQVLDEALEAGDVADEEVERDLRPLGHLVAPGLHHLDRRATRVISGERSSWLTSDANRASRSTRCCSAATISLNEFGQRAQVGVVGRLEAGVEPTAGDRLGRLRGVAERPDGAVGGEHAEQRRRTAS